MFMFCFLEKGLKMAKIRNRYKREFKLKQSYNRYRTSYQTGVTRPNTSSSRLNYRIKTHLPLLLFPPASVRTVKEVALPILHTWQTEQIQFHNPAYLMTTVSEWDRNDIKMGSKWPGAETSLIRADDGAKRPKVLDFSCWIKSSVSLMYSE